MHSNYLLLPILSILFLMSSCKEPEPFEYPEDPIEVEPSWITEAERVIKTDELWKAEQLSDGCAPNLHVSNLAFYELNYSRGFATIQLLPSDNSCEVGWDLEPNSPAARSLRMNGMNFILNSHIPSIVVNPQPSIGLI